MFFAVGLEFSAEKAVKLRNAFSAREIPFGFSCFIIGVKKKTNPQHFPLCCWSAWRKKKAPSACQKPEQTARHCPGCARPLCAGVQHLPAAWVWG